MDPLFQSHQLNDAGAEKAAKLKELFDGLLSGLKALNPRQGREWALVQTKLEEASMFAMKALATHPENQK